MPDETVTLGATEASPTSPDALGADSSTTQNPSDVGVKTASLQETLSKQFEKSTGEKAPESETDEAVAKPGEEEQVEKAEKKSVSKNETDKPEAEAEKTEAEEEAEVETKTGQEGPVPYERFNEVLTQRNTFEQRIKQEFEPKAKNFDDIQRYCNDNMIDPASFSRALELQAMLSTGRGEEFLKAIQPLIEQVQGFVGDKLPADLQARVDDGKVDLDTAKELAQLRGKSEFSRKQTERKQQFDAQREQTRMRAEFETSAERWETEKRTGDPDYVPKKGEKESDGLWEETQVRFQGLFHAVTREGKPVNPIYTPADQIKLLERAYSEAKGFLNRVNRPGTPKRLTANGSSKTTTKKTVESAGSLKEALEIAAAGRI